MASVAREYRVALAELAAANHLHQSDSIEGVEALLVPLAPAAAPARMLMYTARRGDTLVTIADRFGVSLNQLRRWNKLTGIKVEPGRRLHVAEPSVVARASHSHRRRSPASGAKAHGMAPAASHGKASTAKRSSSRQPAAKRKSSSKKQN